MNVIIVGLVCACIMVGSGYWVATRSPAWLSGNRLGLLMAIGTALLLTTLCLEMLPTASEMLGHQAFVWVLVGIVAVVLLEQHLAPRLDRWLTQRPEDRSDVPEPHHHDHGACDHATEAYSTHRVGPMGHVHAMHQHSHLHHGTACTAVGCLVVCTFFDGLSLAAGFSTSAHLGIVLSIGLLLHLLPEGLVAASVLLAAGARRATAQGAAIVIGLALLAGIGTAKTLGVAIGASAVVLALASGVIAYVALGQLLPLVMRTPGGLRLMLATIGILALLETTWPHSHH